MRKLITSLLLVIASATFFACGGENTESKKSDPINVKDISVEEFAQLSSEQPGIILDVRTPGEVAEGYVEGATFIDITQGNFESEAQSLSKDQPIYVYCKAGGRSSNASQKLVDMGYSQVYNVLGGMDEYNQKGLPTIK